MRARLPNSAIQSGTVRRSVRISRKIASRSSAENIPVQKFVAKLALGVVLLAQSNKRRQSFVNRFQLRRGRGEKFSPVRPRLERSQFPFDHRQQLADGG